jgi:hypothetical protein
MVYMKDADIKLCSRYKRTVCPHLETVFASLSDHFTLEKRAPSTMGGLHGFWHSGVKKRL